MKIWYGKIGQLKREHRQAVSEVKASFIEEKDR
jgi:hypothetical protein